MKNSIKNFRKELIVSGVLVLLLVLILNPFHFWMPDMMHMVVLAVTVAVFGIFASFILRERMGDERDYIHRMFSGRVAFLSGATVLILGIIIEAISDNIDPWLVSTLVVMVLGKVFALLYSEQNQ